MLTNYLKIAWRALLRNRLITVLNVAGLAVGMAACLVIYLIVQHEFSFDRHHPDTDRIYRLVSDFRFGDEDYHNGGVSVPVAHAAQSQLAGVAVAADLHTVNFLTIEVPQPNGKPPVLIHQKQGKETGAFVDERFFNIIDSQWLVGSPQTSLKQPNQVALTERQAQVYFGEAGPALIGRTLVAYSFQDTLQLTVSGILKNPAQNSDFDFSVLISRATVSQSPRRRQNLSWEEWDNTNSSSQCLVKLVPGADPKRVIADLTAIVKKNTAEDSSKRWFRLQPLADVHFNADYGGGAHKPTLYGLMAVGAFLLVLACINFINLATAQSTQRAKEIGIRKTLGSARGQLIAQFLGEALLITLVAAIGSVLLARYALGYLGELVPKEIAIDFADPNLWLFLPGAVVVTTLLAGIYPGVLVSRYLPVHTLRNRLGQEAGRTHLRKVLIVSQFVIAQVFIIGSLQVGRQLNYLLAKDLGFNRSAIVTFQVPTRFRFANDNDRRFTLAERIRQVAGVERVSLGSTTPIAPSWSSTTMTFYGKKGPKEVNVYRKVGDPEYLKLYGFKLLAGRSFAASDSVHELVVNETLARHLGFRKPAEAVGQFMELRNKVKKPIVGVVKDFHHRSLHHSILPTALMSEKESLLEFNIQLRRGGAGQTDQALAQIGKLWSQTYATEPFEPVFFDETVARLYKKERNLGKLVNLFTGLSVFVSCLGLFGLATFVAQQRTKEIGIRKVLGASVSSIVALLSTDFVRLVGLAVVIASPLAWYAMHRWLQDFAYKIDLEWWIFAGAGGLAIAIALLTVSFQSFRAALMNPVKSLKTE